MIQILQMNYAYLNGMQKKFLARTVCVLAASIAVTSLAAFGIDSLQVVAAVQVAILGAWWIFNECTLQALTSQTKKDWFKFAGIYVMTAGSYWLMSGNWLGVGASVGLYYLASIIVLSVCGREELKLTFAKISEDRAS
jgi:hypothetical protein